MTVHHERGIVSINDLKPAPYNPREIDAEAVRGLGESLDRFGVVQEIVVNRRTGYIVGGHQRVMVLRDRGETEVPVVWVDLDDDEERALNVALNSRHISGSFTPSVNDLIAELQVDAPALVESLRLDKVLEDVAALAEDNEQGAAGAGEDTGGDAVPETPSSEPGRIYALGPHRVMCGDSADSEAVRELMGDARADLVVTDPPYNVEGESRNFAADLGGGVIRDGARYSGQAYVELAAAAWDRDFEFASVTRSLEASLAEDAAVYVFTSHFLVGEIIAWAQERLAFSSLCVWQKTDPMPSLAKRHWTWATELVVYGTRGRHVFNFPPAGHAPNVWTFATSASNRLHPTAKPLSVIKHPIQHSSKRGALVLDLFLGSGTTLIACADLGRTCYGVERDPKYVDVIRKRWGDWARSCDRDPGPDAL